MAAFRALALSLLTACGTIILDPPPAPPRVVPNLIEAPAPPPEGTTPVAIDSDEPAKVVEKGKDLCLTPCVVNLPPGVHDLEFRPRTIGSGRGGTPSISVGREPIDFRYVMARQEDHTVLGIPGFILAYGGGVVGLTALPFLAFDETRGGAQPVLLGSAIAIAIGVALLIEARHEYTPGSATQWSPEDGQIYTVFR